MKKSHPRISALLRSSSSLIRFKLPNSLAQRNLGAVAKSPIRPVVVRQTCERSQLAVMWLNLFGAGGRVCQMQDAPHFLNARAVGQHLGRAAHVTADAMSHHRFIVAARSLPQVFAGEN